MQSNWCLKNRVRYTAAPGARLDNRTPMEVYRGVELIRRAAA